MWTHDPYSHHPVVVAVPTDVSVREEAERRGIVPASTCQATTSEYLYSYPSSYAYPEARQYYSATPSQYYSATPSQYYSATPTQYYSATPPQYYSAPKQYSESEVYHDPMTCKVCTGRDAGGKGGDGQGHVATANSTSSMDPQVLQRHPASDNSAGPPKAFEGQDHGGGEYGREAGCSETSEADDMITTAATAVPLSDFDGDGSVSNTYAEFSNSGGNLSGRRASEAQGLPAQKIRTRLTPQHAKQKLETPATVVYVPPSPVSSVTYSVPPVYSRSFIERRSNVMEMPGREWLGGYYEPGEILRYIDVNGTTYAQGGTMYLSETGAYLLGVDPNRHVVGSLGFAV